MVGAAAAATEPRDTTLRHSPSGIPARLVSSVRVHRRTLAETIARKKRQFAQALRRVNGASTHRVCLSVPRSMTEAAENTKYEAKRNKPLKGNTGQVASEALLLQKLEPRGIFGIHDYRFHQCPGWKRRFRIDSSN